MAEQNSVQLTKANRKRRADNYAEKMSNFVVDKRIAILVIMLIFAVGGVLCSDFVAINEDMTKYLPDDSNMKAGMDIMTDAFPEMEISNTIRVMFDDLNENDREIILEKLNAVEHVDHVDHDPESAETTAFVHSIRDYANANMDGGIYLIGNSPMNCEMQQIFDTELTFITLLTALAIFLVVALTFRSLSIPLILDFCFSLCYFVCRDGKPSVTRTATCFNRSALAGGTHLIFYV